MDTLIETVQRTKIFEGSAARNADPSRSSPNLSINTSNTLSGDKVVEPTTTIFLQEQCFRHRFIRRKDTSGIVERPERLRAVAAGLSAALARLEDEADRSRNGSQQQQTSVENPGITATEPSDGEQLTYAMSLLDLSSRPARSLDSICRIIHSTASADLTSHPGARFIHAPQKFLSSEEDYLATLKSWAVESQSKIMSGASEIPDAFSQGDLYLCPESFDAISGAIGTVCEAVDCVVNAEAIENSKTRSSSLNASAFVAVRPPGHHCGEATPAGFCFVNNVAVGAAHAHLQHNVDRVIILDIDLHHGNGTQKLAWRINEETRRTELEGSTERRGLKIFYGSLHDVLSYPCEDGDADMIRDASVSLHDAHGQYIENIHLQPYASEQNFHESLYEGTYSALFEKAMAFVKSTGSIPAKTLVFISCGFDACEHEHTYMSRHDRKVPTSFYKRFAMDATALAKAVAGGKIVSVLEGGYSDRALMSGAIAYLAGLACGHSNWSEQTHWWSENNLTKLEKLTKKPRGRSSRVSGPKADVQEKWLDRTQEIFTFLDRSSSVPIPPRLPVQLPQPRMTLRGKKKPAFPDSVDSTPGTSPDRGERFILSDKRGKTPTDERATSADVIQASSANIINVGRVGNDDEDSSRDTHGDSTSDLNARNSVGSGAVQIGAPAIPGSDGGGASLPPTKPLRIKIVKPRSASSAAVP